MTDLDHATTAARRAAVVCRDRAADYDRIAGGAGVAVATVTWSGCERDRVADAVRAVCDDLRREATSLRRTADLLETAAAAAEQRQADIAAATRVGAARAAASAAAPTCRPTWPVVR